MKKNQMNITQLQVLIALAEKSNFTEAAASIHLTQSAASHAMTKLESELGVTLIKRSRNGVALTEFGKDMLNHARDILTSIDTMHQKASMARGAAVGKLRVGSISPMLGTRLLAGIMSNLQREYPDIDIIVFEGTRDEVYEWIMTGVVDIGFVSLNTQGLERIPVCQDELQVYVYPGHPLANHKSINLNDIADEPLIVSQIGCDTAAATLVGFSQDHLNIRYLISDGHTILTMVREGLGISIVPKMIYIDNLADIHLIPFDPPAIFNIELGVRSLEKASPLVTLFIEQARIWAWTHDCAPKVAV